MMKKARLLELIAGKNRGLLANELDRQAILAAIAELEDYNPNPRPLEVPELLEGNWQLLYTSSQELLGIDRFPFYNLGKTYQCIRVKTGKIYNIAEVLGIPYLEGLVSVAARFEAVSERRVEVKFNRFVIGLQRFLGYQSANQFINAIESDQKFLGVDFKINPENQQGWLDITYLDENLRIGRGNEGSVFILTKVP
ncbi:PAP/fibrillin family protein [Capilliphycus salinus ALCB114379]|uniref:PAP/fibrillin family protein n=1 Tax=Capilliphycus salinus TaxID=2768948 RepID=UPI0039A723B7